jgi:hypothetical protein
LSSEQLLYERMPSVPSKAVFYGDSLFLSSFGNSASICFFAGNLHLGSSRALMLIDQINFELDNGLSGLIGLYLMMLYV